jgi:hypothetical protein
VLGCVDRRWNWDDKDIDVELHEVVHEARDTIQFSLGTAIIDHEVFPLGITEVSQPLPQRVDIRPLIGSIASP